MANLVLYRKYRPQKFSEVVGQKHVVQTLTNAVRYNMVGHAYLFAGPRGTGKTTMARLLAKAVNCASRKEGSYEPCGTCESCVEIAKGNAIDLVEIDAASNRGVDEIRELKEGIRFAPNKAKHRVFIIDECHQLTRDASSALLKILEEPPSHAIFILATTDPQKMIPTISSRCQRFDFHAFSVEEIASRLALLSTMENIVVEEGVFEIVASQAGGSIRDAESIFHQLIIFCGKKIRVKDARTVLGIVDVNEAADLMDLFAEGNLSDAVARIHAVLQRGADPREFLKTLTSYARQMLLANIDSSLISSHVLVGTPEQRERLTKQAAGFERDQLKKMVEIFVASEEMMKYAPFAQIPLELAAVEITDMLARKQPSPNLSRS